MSKKFLPILLWVLFLSQTNLYAQEKSLKKINTVSTEKTIHLHPSPVLDKELNSNIISKDNAEAQASEEKEPKSKSKTIIKTGKVNVDMPLSDSSADVETIDRKTFDQFEMRKASDVINDSTSINTITGSRGEVTFKMRGFKQEQVPVLLDGIPIYIPYDGIIGLDRIPAANIGEIKLIKSAPSVIYGPNAFGGAINIITRKPEKPFELEVRFDDSHVNTLNEGLYLGARKNNIYFTFNHSFSKSHGFNMSHSFEPDANENGGIRDNSAYHSLSLGGTFGYSSNKNQDYRVTYSYLDSPWNVSPEILVKRPRYWKFNKWRKNTVIFSAKQGLAKDRFIFQGNVFYDKYYNILDSYDNNLYNTQQKKYAFHSIYDDYSVGFNIVPTINLCKYASFRPIFLYKRDIHRETPDYNEARDTYKASTTTLGGAITLKPCDKIAIEGGITADRNHPLYNNGDELRDVIWALNAQGGISFLINDTNKLYFSIGKKTRFPYLKEMYSGFIGRNIPNPDLKQETAFTYEAGYTNTFKNRTKLDISFYQSRLNNLIIDVPVAPQVSQLQNVSKAINTGVDVDFSVDIIKKRIKYNIGYSYISARNRSENRTNSYIPYVPKHKVYTGFDFNLPYGFFSQVNLMYVSPVIYQDNNDLQWHKLGGYPLIDFSVGKTFKKHYTAFVSLRNMLDKNYETEARFPMPGISVIMGLKLNI